MLILAVEPAHPMGPVPVVAESARRICPVCTGRPGNDSMIAPIWCAHGRSSPGAARARPCRWSWCALSDPAGRHRAMLPLPQPPCACGRIVARGPAPRAARPWPPRPPSSSSRSPSGGSGSRRRRTRGWPSLASVLRGDGGTRGQCARGLTGARRRPARCWHARNPTPRAAPVGPL